MRISDYDKSIFKGVAVVAIAIVLIVAFLCYVTGGGV